MADLIVVEKLKRQKWFRISFYVTVVVGLSVGFAYLLQYFMAYFNMSTEGFGSSAYLVVFGVTLLSNASIMFPVAIHASVMMAAASQWDPLLVALVASVGGTLG